MILLQENIQNTLFSVQCEKKIRPKLLCRRTDIPQKSWKSLLIVSGTLGNKNARGIKHELFVKSICIHTYCETLLESTQNAPFETWCKGSQQQSPLCHFQGASSDNCILPAFIRFTLALQNLYKMTLSIFWTALAFPHSCFCCSLQSWVPCQQPYVAVKWRLSHTAQWGPSAGILEECGSTCANEQHDDILSLIHTTYYSYGKL